jgi:hypothetical protein
MCFLQDDIVKFVSEPASPPRLVEIPEEGKGKAKECREVGEGDDTVVVEGTSDEETLQERFQLRSRFSRPRLPNVPLIQDPPTSFEASLPALPRKPRNVARKLLTDKRRIPLRSASVRTPPQGSCQSAEQGDYKRSINNDTLVTKTLTILY